MNVEERLLNMSAIGQPPMNPAVTFQAVSVNSRLQKP